MSGPATATDLIDLLRRSRLLDATKLDDVLRDGPGGSPKDLASHLVREKLLTPFQAEQLLRGKYKGFSLGKYRVLDRIGSGGMGRVYLAEHTSLGRRVAIKVLPPSLASDETAKLRFRREARAAAALDHPNIVRVFDLDHAHGLDLLVMEFVDGRTLSQLVRKAGQLSIARAVNYLRQTAVGLGHAHAAGLVHRDIKPLNLLLDRQGTVKILDMGLARFADGRDAALTRVGDGILGTADYLAPEQALDPATADFRADVYSLGATAYFLFTSRPPFPEGTTTEKLIAHQMREPKLLREIRADVPEVMEAIVSRMLAKSPDDRFANASEVAAALAEWLPERVAVAVPVSPVMVPLVETLSSAATPVPELTAGPVPRRVRPPGKIDWNSRWLGAVVAVVAAIGFAGGVGVFDSPTPVVADPSKLTVRAGGTHATLAAALADVPAGGTVTVAVTELREAVRWSEAKANVTVVCPKGVTWRPPPDHPPGQPLLDISTADNFTVHGIHFDGENHCDALIRVGGGTATLADCQFDRAAVGLQVEGPSRVQVERNRFGTHRGVVVKSPAATCAARLIDNVFTGADRAADVDGCPPLVPSERLKAIRGPGAIWSARRLFDLNEEPVRRGELDVMTDGKCEAWLNGQPVAAWSGGDVVPVTEVGRYLRPKRNVLAVRVRGTWLRGRLTMPAGELVTDANWRVSSDAEPGWLAPSVDALHWPNAEAIAAPVTAAAWQREAMAVAKRFPWFPEPHGNRREGTGPVSPFVPGCGALFVVVK